MWWWWLCCRCVWVEGVLQLTEEYGVRETIVLISGRETSGTVQLCSRREEGEERAGESKETGGDT